MYRLQSSHWKLPRWRRKLPADPVARAEEVSLAEGFVVRSFPKGISQRHVVVQDFVEGVRLTIAQVRAAIRATTRTVRAVYQRIDETRAQLLQRLTDEARLAMDRQTLREGRQARGIEYEQACARLRWSEITSDRGWASAAA